MIAGLTAAAKAVIILVFIIGIAFGCVMWAIENPTQFEAFGAKLGALVMNALSALVDWLNSLMPAPGAG